LTPRFGGGIFGEPEMAKAKKVFMGRHRSVMSRVDAMQTGYEKRIKPKKKKKKKSTRRR